MREPARRAHLAVYGGTSAGGAQTGSGRGVDRHSRGAGTSQPAEQQLSLRDGSSGAPLPTDHHAPAASEVLGGLPR